jgi:hypothetical protein
LARLCLAPDHVQSGERDLGGGELLNVGSDQATRRDIDEETQERVVCWPNGVCL